MQTTQQYHHLAPLSQSALGRCSPDHPAFQEVVAPRYKMLAGNWTGTDGCDLVDTDLCDTTSLCDDWDFAVDGSRNIAIAARAGQHTPGP